MTELSGTIAKPQQMRSELSLQKILDASRKRIGSASYEEASIADIVSDAGLSVGAFYARFKDKSSLFHAIQVQVLAELRSTIEGRIDGFEAAANAREIPVNVRQVSEFLVDTLIATYNHSPGLLRAIYAYSFHKSDLIFNQRIEQFNLDCIEQSLRILNRLAATPIDDSARKVWNSAISIIGTFLRESIVFGDPVLREGPFNEHAVRGSALAMMNAYLTDQLKVEEA